LRRRSGAARLVPAPNRTLLCIPFLRLNILGTPRFVSPLAHLSGFSLSFFPG